MGRNMASITAMDCLITRVSFAASSLGNARPMSIPKQAWPTSKASRPASKTTPCHTGSAKAQVRQATAARVQGTVSSI